MLQVKWNLYNPKPNLIQKWNTTRASCFESTYFPGKQNRALMMMMMRRRRRRKVLHLPLPPWWELTTTKASNFCVLCSRSLAFGLSICASWIRSCVGTCLGSYLEWIGRGVFGSCSCGWLPSVVGASSSMALGTCSLSLSLGLPNGFLFFIH